jgi:hypothetical protein
MAVIETLTLGYTIAGILVFLLWYTLLSSRLFGFLVSLILRLVLSDSVLLDINGIHIALLTGRIYFRRLTYVTPNASLNILDGTIRIFWWRSIIMFGNNSEEEGKPSHISISLNGVEYTIANNSKRREQIEKILSMRQGKDTQVGVQDLPLVATLPFLFKLSPRILLHVHRGVICIGNSFLESALVASFDSAKALIEAEDAAEKQYVYGLKVSSELFQLTVREQPPFLTPQPSRPQKEAPPAPVRVQPEQIFSTNFKTAQQSRSDKFPPESNGSSGRISGGMFLDVERVVKFGQDIKQLGTHAFQMLEGAGAKLMKLDEHILNLLNHNVHSRPSSNKSSGSIGTVILSCPKLVIQYLQECDGVATECVSQPPQWKIQLDFFSSFLRYGPTEHFIKNAILRFFLPWTYEEQVVRPVSVAFETQQLRGFDFLIIDIRFREVVDVIVPFHGVKQTYYPDLHIALPNQFARPSESGHTAWLHLKCGNGVPLEDIDLHHDVTPAEVNFPQILYLLSTDTLIVILSYAGYEK